MDRDHNHNNLKSHATAGLSGQIVSQGTPAGDQPNQTHGMTSSMWQDYLRRLRDDLEGLDRRRRLLQEDLRNSVLFTARVQGEIDEVKSRIESIRDLKVLPEHQGRD